MYKRLFSLALVLALVCAVGGISVSASHDINDGGWVRTETTHQYHCPCGVVEPEMPHRYRWVVDQPATVKAAGVQHEMCSQCGYVRSENTPIPKLLLGDVDGNGRVTTTDARLTLRYAARRIDPGDLDLSVADIDGSGRISTIDARLILSLAAGRITGYP